MALPQLSPIYDEGYHTGADVSVFIGPLWVEEAVSIYLRTATNDIVVYPYSDPHYSRSLVGRYLMQGSLTINVTEPDYLLRLIEVAKNESITESALRELVEKRKAVFQQTLTDRLLSTYSERGSITIGGSETDEEKLLAYITEYTERVTREVELMSVRYTDSGKRIIDPRTFELTIISGKPGSRVESIEIFQDVKIVGTERVSENNDQTQTVTYSIIARRKPPLVTRKPNPKAKITKASFVTENILEVTQTLCRKLIDQILTTPELRCVTSVARTAEMLNNPYVGYIGDVSPKSRFYGKHASYLELVWQVRLPATYTPDITKGNLPAISLLMNKDAGVTETETSMSLKLPKFEGANCWAFSNAYGRLASVNKDLTLEGLSAAASVVITPLESRDGMGTLYAPRKHITGFGVGSLVPPQLVDPTTFGYTDDLLDDLTASTLWANPFNIRACSHNVGTPAYVEKAEELTELVQPVYTYGIIDKIEISEKGITLSVPVPVDFKNLEKKTNEALLASSEKLKESESEYTITIDLDGKVTTTDPLIYPDFDIALTYLWTTVDATDIPTEEDLITSESPAFGVFTLDLVAPEQLSSFNRYLNVFPIVFQSVPPLEMISGSVECWDDGAGGYDHVFTGSLPDDYLDSVDGLADLPTLVKLQSVCAFTIDYDVTFSGIAHPYYNLDGCFFMTKNVKTMGSYQCPHCDQPVKYWKIKDLPAYAHVLWIAISTPIKRVKDSEQTEERGVKVVHDTTMRRARIAEFYNIVRCDSRAYDTQVMDTAGTMFVKGLGEIWHDILDTIKAVFGRIGTVDRTIYGFTYPIKASMGRIAQMFSSYTIDINVTELVDQISQCTIDTNFTGGPQGKIDIEGVAPNDPVTLLNALIHSRNRAGKPFVGGIDGANAKREIATIVRNVLTEALSLGAYEIITENEKTGDVSVRRHTLRTLPSLVCYGLTDEGYRVLTETSQQSQPIVLDHYRKEENNQ